MEEPRVEEYTGKSMTLRHWLTHIRPEIAEPLTAWGCKHCGITTGGSRFKLTFDDPPYPWVMTENGFPGFDRQLDTAKPCVVMEACYWPFMESLLQAGQLELDTLLQVVNTRYTELTLGVLTARVDALEVKLQNLATDVYRVSDRDSGSGY